MQFTLAISEIGLEAFWELFKSNYPFQVSLLFLLIFSKSFLIESKDHFLSLSSGVSSPKDNCPLITGHVRCHVPWRIWVCWSMMRISPFNSHRRTMWSEPMILPFGVGTGHSSSHCSPAYITVPQHTSRKRKRFSDCQCLAGLGKALCQNSSGRGPLDPG